MYKAPGLVLKFRDFITGRSFLEVYLSVEQLKKRIHPVTHNVIMLFYILVIYPGCQIKGAINFGLSGTEIKGASSEHMGLIFW